MSDSDKLRKYKKSGIIAGGIILFLLLAVTAGEAWLKQKIRGVIESGQEGITSGTYEVEVGRIGVSLPGRSVLLKDVRFKTGGDTHARQSYRIRSIDANIKQVTLSGISIKKSGGKHTLKARAFKLDSPVITVNVNAPQTIRTQESAPPAQQISATVAVNNVNVNNGAFEYVVWNDNDKARYKVQGLKMDAADFVYDSISPQRGFSVGNVEAFAQTVEYRLDSKAITLTVESVNIDTHGRALSIQGVSLIPGYPKYEYAAKIPGHTDWTRLIGGGIDCHGFDYEALKTEGTVRIDSMTIASAEIASYKNRQARQQEKEKPLFFVSLQKMENKISIPVIEIQDAEVAYEELSEEGLTPGLITISDLSGRFEGLTNISGERTHFTLDSRGKLFGAGELNVGFTFPVHYGDTHFSAAGSLGAMPLAPLNDMITPLSNIRIDEGNLKSMTFQIEGNSVEAGVTLQFLYENLSISVLKRKDGELVKYGLITGIVDGMLVKTDNPDRNGTYTATGSFTRDPLRSQFNYLWKTIFTGVEHSVIGRRPNNL